MTSGRSYLVTLDVTIDVDEKADIDWAGIERQLGDSRNWTADCDGDFWSGYVTSATIFGWVEL